MKKLLLILMAMFYASAFGVEYNWEPHGKIFLDIPISWNIHAVSAGDIGYNFDLRPKNNSNANCKITIAYIKQKPIKGVDDLKERLLAICSEFVSGSVEGKTELKPLEMKKGIGVYVQLTDKSLAGKPTPDGEHKVMRNALVGPIPNVMAVISVFFDDPSQKEVNEMMSIVQSLRFDETVADQKK